MLFSINISASVVAWYGAIVATFGAIITLYNVFQDRGRIKITHQKDARIMNAVPPWAVDKDYFIVHITNLGRRPVAVGNVAIKYIQGENYLLADSLYEQQTRILTEEKPHAMIKTDQSEIDFLKVHSILVYDQAGREYRKYFSLFPTFKKWIYFLKKKTLNI